ncbi:DMT family transporter [Idiomarina aquatica]|uniref:EamA family transporter n=1 Tax=Idiomarina aquatica TaxID=1327752 RepID=A0AA94EEF9_9GAMM|nr:EamA family transporter [Idiomarina aquatica]RUO43408.1 EamA family transporter [Idiomarina aquatica]
MGIKLVALAALFWGVSGGIAGILTGNGWDPLVVSFYRGAIGLVFILGWLCLRPRYSGLRKSRLWFWGVLAGLGIAGNFAFYFYSIVESSVAVASTLMYCAPIFVYLLSFLLGIERPTTVKYGAILLVLLGVVLLTRVYDVGGSGVTLWGTAAGLLSGLSLALFIFGFKYAVPHGSAPAILTIAFVTLVTVLAIASDTLQLGEVLTSSDGWLFALLGTFGGGVAFVVYLTGLKRTPPALASIIATIEPVSAALFGVVLLGESLRPIQIAGMSLILFTVTALGVYASRSRH